MLLAPAGLGDGYSHEKSTCLIVPFLYCDYATRLKIVALQLFLKQTSPSFRMTVRLIYKPAPVGPHSGHQGRAGGPLGS